MRWRTGAGLCCLSLCLAAVGQAADPPCGDLTYENRNQTDYGPLHVPGIRGIAQDAKGGPIPKACVGVFTEVGHKLIAVTQANGTGRFELKNIPDGEYRLVTKYEGFCPANAKVVLERRAKGKKRLTVQMRFAGLDDCSYVQLK
jgi:Carboxypeptidase regulatory-like domain